MKTIEFDQAAYDSLIKIAQRENFPEAIRILSKYNTGEIALNEDESQVLADVLAYEVSRVCLRYPYNEDDEGYEENDEWDEIVQSVYPSTISILKEHFEIKE